MYCHFTLFWARRLKWLEMASDKHIWVSFKSRFKSILCYTYGCKEELKSTRFCYVCWKLRSSSKNSVNHFVHFPRIDPIRQWICKLLFLGCVIIKVFLDFVFRKIMDPSKIYDWPLSTGNEDGKTIIFLRYYIIRTD